MSTSRHFFLTNDDGIDSIFLHALAEALSPHATLTIVAPVGEQSWISKGISRYRTLQLENADHAFPSALSGSGHRIFRLNGTPADCVNVGLAHCCPTPPDLVISGINIGFNAGLPFILSSGTVAGALEGALHQVPALAFSMALPPEQFNLLKETPPRWTEATLQHLRTGAARAPEFLEEALRTDCTKVLVHNINFPFPVAADTPVERTVPARLKIGALFQANPAGHFGFSFPGLPDQALDPGTDSGALQNGLISHSLLNFDLLHQPAGL